MKAYHETLREAQKFLEKNQTLNEDLHENDNPSQKEVELKSTVESGNQTLGSDFNSGPKVGVCSLTGIRSSNEDSHVIFQKKIDGKILFIFLGVFDGHGGKQVSSFISKNLPEKLVNLASVGKEEVRRIFQSLNQEIFQKYVCDAYITWFSRRERKEWNEVGSCASFCFITKSEEKYHLLVGNVGDSRVILCKGNQCIPLTVDHKPNREDEETRIKHNGGTVTKKKNDVCRVNGVLSVSRAFGDQKLTKWVSSEIEFQEEAAEVGDFLIICCDGLLETFTNEACVQYISERRSQTPDLNALAKQIAQESITSGSDDNVTVMLCEL